MVNEKWSKLNIRQRCKLDCVEVGDNWKNFLWPNKPPKSKKFKRIVILIQAALRFSSPVPTCFQIQRPNSVYSRQSIRLSI